VLGIFPPAQEARLTPAQEDLVARRARARAARDFQEADRLRDLLAKEGVLVKDTKDGQTVSFA
jgi:cysteinyl-tRNA synthetase